MRHLILVAAALLVLTVSSLSAQDRSYTPPTEEQILAKWLTFKADHEIHSDDKYQRFREEYLRVEAHNYQFYHNNGTYLTQVNMISLADLTGDQNLLRFGLRLGGRARARSNYHLQNARASIPETVDWRNTFVRASHFQSTCGACWAFATTGVTESFAYRKHNIRQEFSVQQLIDCTPSTRVNIPPAMRNQGCRGGYPDNGLDYVKAYGLADAHVYQYTAKDGVCMEMSFNRTKLLRGHADVPYAREDLLKKAVALYGPVAIGIDASKWGFSSYQDGIYDDKDCSSIELNHAVIVVGYGTDNGNDYWLVRNSWGPNWGINGYIKMARNKGNMCGIATLATYVY